MSMKEMFFLLFLVWLVIVVAIACAGIADHWGWIELTEVAIEEMS